MKSHETPQLPREQINDNGESYVKTEHFRIRFFDGTGEEILPDEETIRTVEYTKYQDVLDLVPYIEKNGTILMGITHALRPALIDRPNIIEPVPGIDDTPPPAKLWEIPSAYIRLETGETSLSDTVKKILDKKVDGATPAGQLEILGGSYLPSVGGSTEMVFPRALAVEESPHTNPDLKFVPLQEIIDGYFSGLYQDTRLIELTFRLAEKKRMPLRVPDLPLTRITEAMDLGADERFADRDTIRKLVSQTYAKKGFITHIEAVPTTAPAQPFLHTRSIEVNAEDEQGQVHTERTDILVRKGVDSVDVGTYFWKGRKLYMPIKRGIRSSLAVRNLQKHPIHTDSSPIFLEGVAGSLEGEKTLDQIKERAITETEEEIGIQTASAPVYVGADYPSPGHNPERAYRFLVEVNPQAPIHRHQGIDETTDVWYVDVDDVITLANEGVIKDPRLSLNAHLLKKAFQYEAADTTEELGTPEQLNAFEELINSGSRIQEWLSHEAREVDNKLNESVLYRRLKMYCENELGVVALTLPHPEEAHFFSAMVPIFAIPQPDDPRKLPFYFLHDLFHYATGDYLPIQTENGKLSFRSQEEYHRACSGDECEAVWYSDVVMPGEFGLDRAEEIFRGHSVARAFRELEIDQTTAKKMIRSIELDGVLPQELTAHPRFDEFRDVFIHRLLRYHILDRENTKNVYTYWTQHPSVAMTARRFCDAFDDVEEYERYYHDTLSRIQNYTEGSNPLRAALSRTINYHLRLAALKLSFMKDLLKTATSPEAEETRISIDTKIETLHVAYQELTNIRKTVQDIDMSKNNLTAFRLLTRAIETICTPIEEFASTLGQNKNLFTAEQRERLQGRLLPYFESFQSVDKTLLEQELADIEKKQREK